MSPFQLARRHWRLLAPTWLMPAVLMLFITVQDLTGSRAFLTQSLPFILLPLMLLGTVTAARLQCRERLPWGVFYLIWLAPMMAVWVPLVFIRAAVLTALGRPL